MLLGRAALAKTSTFLFAMMVSVAAEASDPIIYERFGNECKNAFGASAGSFDVDTVGLRRKSGDGGSIKTVYCPIPTDIKTTFRFFFVRMLVTRTTGTVTCELGAYSAHGALLGGAVLDSDAISINIPLYLQSPEYVAFPAGTAQLGVLCTLPENAYISSYEFGYLFI
ncbi:MAG: hypothetical protein IPG45_16145 [Deltaproteobacteria bacterium]|nr:hypothetical protein [Deltaproteobacteria bacterium]